MGVKEDVASVLHENRAIEVWEVLLEGIILVVSSQAFTRRIVWIFEVEEPHSDHFYERSSDQQDRHHVPEKQIIFRLVPRVPFIVVLGTDKSLLLIAGGVIAAGILKYYVIVARMFENLNRLRYRYFWGC